MSIKGHWNNSLIAWNIPTMGVHFEVALRRLVGPDRSGMNDRVVGSRFATDDMMMLFGVVWGCWIKRPRMASLCADLALLMTFMTSLNL